MTTDADLLCAIHRIAANATMIHAAEALAKVRALLSEGEPAKVRDESKPAPGWTICDVGRGMYILEGGLTNLAGTWANYDDEHGYAPQGAPLLPDGWTVERCNGEDAAWWEAYRESDAASIQWWDDNDLVIDVNVGECSKGDEVLAVMQHLAARRGAPPEDE